MDMHAIRALLQRIAAEQSAQEMGLDIGQSGSGPGSQILPGMGGQLANSSESIMDSQDPQGELELLLQHPNAAMDDQRLLTEGANSGMDIQSLMRMLKGR